MERCRCGKIAEYAVVGDDRGYCGSCVPPEKQDRQCTDDTIERMEVNLFVESAIGRLPGWATEERGRQISDVTDRIMAYKK